MIAFYTVSQLLSILVLRFVSLSYLCPPVPSKVPDGDSKTLHSLICLATCHFTHVSGTLYLSLN